MMIIGELSCNIFKHFLIYNGIDENESEGRNFDYDVKRIYWTNLSMIIKNFFLFILLYGVFAIERYETQKNFQFYFIC